MTFVNPKFCVGDLIICENFACGGDVRFLVVVRQIKHSNKTESVLTLVSASDNRKESCSIERFRTRVFVDDEIIKV